MKMANRKKLIEVALPIVAINTAAAREKSIRFGHPSTLHLWWARRPLAACRAVLFASLVDDPDSDPMFAGDEDLAASKRAELFNLIEELVLWENSLTPRVINRARAEIARCVATQKIEEGVFKKDDVLAIMSPLPSGDGKGAKGNAKSIKVPVFEIRQLLAKPEQVNAFLAEHAPPVLDPFCGGGSIPLEAQRLGLRAYGSDLNPVSVLITKALIEIPPKFTGLPPVNTEWQTKSAGEKAALVWEDAQGLTDDVRHYGRWMRAEAEKRIGHLYPKVKITKEMAKDRPDLMEYIGTELTIIAWLWTRTVESPDPACKGTQVPLVRTFCLSTKKGREAWVEPVIDRATNHYQFELRLGKPPASGVVKDGTVNRRGATCLLSKTPIPFDYIRAEGKAGRLGARLLAMVAETAKGRIYLPPLERHETVARSEMPKDYPDTSLPAQALSMRVMLYGMDKHYKLFTHRQLVWLCTISDLVGELWKRVFQDAANAGLPREPGDAQQSCMTATDYATAVVTYLGLAVSRSTNTHCTLAIWSTGRDQSINAFGRQAMPMTWDYPEVNPFARAAGDLSQTVESMTKVIEKLPCGRLAEVAQLDATQAVARVARPVISTDPPYYDNIGYADLSDFFYIWLRRSLLTFYPSLFATLLTPKTEELIATPFRHGGNREKAQKFFEAGLGKAFSRIRQTQNEAFPVTVFYAFKQSETDDDEDGEDGAERQTVASTGWETMLEGLIRAGFAITGTWPLRTERDQGLKTGSNVLASSIVLVCRPSGKDSPIATRKEFINALRRELPDALRNLQHGSIAPVDLAQASIGPGMAVFTRYAKVMETDGSPMTVRTALGLINQALDEVLAEQEGEFDGDTRWALAWFEQYGIDEGPFGVAETLSKAKNTSVGGLVEAGFLQAQSGKVRLLRREELDAEWDPATDKRLTMWEITQYLIRKLEQEGESAAAVLVHKLGGMAETARDLAYRLYSICERKKWANEALAYNGLVIAWPELTKLAIGERSKAPAKQSEMF